MKNSSTREKKDTGRKEDYKKKEDTAQKGASDTQKVFSYKNIDNFCLSFMHF